MESACKLTRKTLLFPRMQSQSNTAPSIPWLAMESALESEKIAKLRKIRKDATRIDWLNSTLRIDESGEWEAVPKVHCTHEALRKAKRKAFNLRKDGWIHPEEREAVAQKVIRHVLRKIECRSGIKVSATSARFSEGDGMAVGMQVLTRAGFFNHGRITLSTFREIRNAIQGKPCFRLRCTWEDASDDIAGVAAQVGFSTECEEITRRLTPSQRDMAKEVMRTLRAAQACDPSRKVLANFRSHRDFWLTVLGYLTERTPRNISSGAFDTRAFRFRKYLADGAAHLRETGALQPRLAKEIMECLASRAFKNPESETPISCTEKIDSAQSLGWGIDGFKPRALA